MALMAAKIVAACLHQGYRQVLCMFFKMAAKMSTKMKYLLAWAAMPHFLHVRKTISEYFFLFTYINQKVDYIF